MERRGPGRGVKVMWEEEKGNAWQRSQDFEGEESGDST